MQQTWTTKSSRMRQAVLAIGSLAVGLVLKLTNGQEYSLFAPGRFFSGASSRATVEGWRQRLEGYLAV